MLVYGKEPWFRSWVKDGIESFDIKTIFKVSEEKSNTVFSDQEREYYTAVLDKTISLVREVIEVDFNEKYFNRLSLFKNRPKKIRQTIDKDDTINFESR